MKKIVLYTLLIYSCCSCQAGDEFSLVTWQSKHLIDYYIDVEDVMLEFYSQMSSKPYIVIRFRGGDIYPSPELYDEVMKWDYLSDCPIYYGNEAFVAKFNELASQNGDKGFLRKNSYWVLGEDAKTGKLLTFDNIFIRCNKAIVQSISDVKITSDADFDDEHPAGSSLENITSVDIMSYALMLRSGKNDNPRCLKPFAELSAEELKIIGDYLAFSFMRKPSLSKVHNLTVMLTLDDGKVFTNTIKMEF